MNDARHLAELINKMLREGLPQIAIDNFSFHYQALLKATSNHVAEHCIKPVTMLPDESKLDDEDFKTGCQALSKTVLLKLNGGLGTSMGLQRAKSLIEIKDDNTFLDVIARQCIKADIPLVLMNSFVTHGDTLDYLEKYNELELGRNLYCFEQHRVPRIRQPDLRAFSAINNDADWCPPGHGDLYPALVSSGTLDQLLNQGFEYVFVSNSDNLGAVIDEKLLGYFVRNDLPFMMEVCKRTQSDTKGGHLASDPHGRLMLRETAQCAVEDRPHFENIQRHRYFNSNNIWINLKALKKKLDEYDNVLPLDLICNSKSIVNQDGESTPVFQLETAMGAAISLFDRAAAICVDRKRFIPVKNTADLLRTRSNLFLLSDDDKLVSNPLVKGEMPKITLDDRYYKTINQYQQRFAHGEPDLVNCETLTVSGDVVFGQGIRMHGPTLIENHNHLPLFLKNNLTLTGSRTWSER